jgi:choice-of-anchor C domain-containing protein
MNKIAVALSFGLLTAVSTTGAKANLIVNGSFENGTFADPDIIAGHFVDLVPGDTKLTGWTVSVGKVNWHRADPSFVSPARDGTKMIDLINNGGLGGTLTQTFATTAGTQYELAFWLAGPNVGFENPRTVRVNLGNGSDHDLTTAASPSNQTTWERKTVLFTATAASTTLSFVDPPPTPGTVFWGAFIDDVSVVEAGGGPDPGGAPVPLPSTLLLLGAGLVALGARRVTR